MDKIKYYKILSIYNEYLENTSRYNQNTLMAINLVRKYTQSRKEYNFNLNEILGKYFKVSINKIGPNFNLSSYIEMEEHKLKKELKYFSLNKLINNKLFVLLCRDLSPYKGEAVLLPLIKHLTTKNKYLSLELPEDIYIINDYYYFTVFANNRNATHRLVGLCESIDFFSNKNIKLEQTKMKKVVNKKLVNDAVLFLIKEIDFKDNRFEIILINQKKIIFEEIDYKKIIQLVKSSQFKKILFSLNCIECESIFINKKSISILNNKVIYFPFENINFKKIENNTLKLKYSYLATIKHIKNGKYKKKFHKIHMKYLMRNYVFNNYEKITGMQTPKRNFLITLLD